MKLALFDFDQTLIQQNSLGKLFKAASGVKHLWLHAIPAIFSKTCFEKGVRRAIKERLYFRCLSGVTPKQMYEIGQQLADQFAQIDAVVDVLKVHAENGGDVWIVTASPAPFIQGIVDKLGWPCVQLLGTELPQSNGAFTGELLQECADEEKVRRILSEIQLTDNVTLELAYGNLPPDGPMLEMVERGFVVQDQHVRSFTSADAKKFCKQA